MWLTSIQLPGNNCFFHDNKCILSGDGIQDYAQYGANDDVTALPFMGNNTIWSLNGSTSINGFDLETFQKNNKHDLGSVVVKGMPEEEEIIKMAREILWKD